MMSDGPALDVHLVDGEDLPPCARCGRQVMMNLDLRQAGHGAIGLCLTCDQDRPTVAAWLNYVAAGKARHVTTPEHLAEVKGLWAACLSDVLLGLAVPPSHMN